MVALTELGGLMFGVHIRSTSVVFPVSYLTELAKKMGIVSQKALCDFIGVPRGTKILILMNPVTIRGVELTYQMALLEEVFHVLMDGARPVEDSGDHLLGEIVNDVLQIVFYPSSQVDNFLSEYKNWTKDEKLALIKRYVVDLGIDPNTSMRTLIEKLRDDVKNRATIQVGSKTLTVAGILAPLKVVPPL